MAPLDMWIFVNHAPDDDSGGCDDGDTSDGDVISTCLSSIMRRTLHPRSGRQLVKMYICSLAASFYYFAPALKGETMN